MSMPIVPTLLASVAGAAWLNAKTQLSHDVRLLYPYWARFRSIHAREKRDRVNFFYILEEHATAKATAGSPCLVWGGKTWTYKEVYDIVLQYGTWLKQEFSILPGEVIAMDFMNKPQFLFLWLGIWSLGAHPAFINYNLTGKSLLHSVRSSTSRLLFVDEQVKYGVSQELLDALTTPGEEKLVQVFFFDEATEQHILSIEGVREPDSSRAGAKGPDIANLIYTSGTTGLPKPAIVSWSKVYIGSGIAAGCMSMKRSDRFYTCMPLYHTSAASLGFCNCLIIGSAFLLGHKFSTRTFWPEVRAHNATIIQYVGEACRYLLAAPPQYDPVTGADLDSKNDVRLAFGNGLRPDIWDRFKQRFGIETICEFYAATESPSALFNTSSNNFSSGAVGRSGLLVTSTMGARLALVETDRETERPTRCAEANNHCVRVKRGEPGELIHKLDPADISRSFQGYYGDAKATESKILRDVFVKGDAWYRTGDHLRRDADGRWWFCDRIGDTFRWKSENVSTTEVSEALGMHPYINEANVYGVKLPHHDGRAGCAAVLLSRDLDQAMLDQVASHNKQTLPKYAVPLFLRIVSNIKATGTNKQQKHLLRAEGVDPGKVRDTQGDKIYWLKGGTYVEFGDADWEEMKAGRVKL